MGVSEKMASAIEKTANKNGREYSDFERRTLRCNDCFVTAISKSGIKTESVKDISGQVAITFCETHGEEYTTLYGKSPVCSCGDCGKSAIGEA